MSFGKQDASSSQGVDVRSLYLRVATQATDPVIEIIDGDEENIGPVIRHDLRGGDHNGPKAGPNSE